MSDESKQMFKFLDKMQFYKAEFPFQTIKGSSKVSLERNYKHKDQDMKPIYKI